MSDLKDLEKHSTGSHDEVAQQDSPSETTDYPGKGTAMEKKLMRKVDLRLIPTLGFMYACSLIDRTNLPNARVTGMDAALGFSVGNRYSLAVLLFFVPYIIFEIPANLALKAGVHPRIWLSSATLGFGAVMIAHAFAPNWYTLVGLRIPLGFLESLLFPGAIFLISSWYPRYETQKRISAFYLTGASFSGFSNIISYGFSTMAGLQGLGGWQWIFIMMGILTCASALIGYAVIPNFPAKATFVTEEERQLVHDRINADRRDFTNEPLTARGVLAALGSAQIWASGLLFCLSTVSKLNEISAALKVFQTPAYAFSYFLVIILADFGYSVKDSQLLSAPPYVLSVILGLIVAYFADRTRMRGPFVIGGALTSAVGTIIVGYAGQSGVRYFGSFLAIIGSWSQNNVRGYTTRAVSSAIVVGSGGIGGIVASLAFQQKDRASGYRPGLWTAITGQIVVVIVASLLMLYYRSQNAKAIRGEKILQGSKGFLYTL